VLAELALNAIVPPPVIVRPPVPVIGTAIFRPTAGVVASTVMVGVPAPTLRVPVPSMVDPEAESSIVALPPRVKVDPVPVLMSPPVMVSPAAVRLEPAGSDTRPSVTVRPLMLSK
jgi:hypothetical protein